MEFRVQGEHGLMPRIKTWASDSPEPAGAVLEASAGLDEAFETMAMVPLCVGDSCVDGEFQIVSSEAAQVEGRAVGYFRPLLAVDQPGGFGGGISFYTEGPTENYFGTYAGENATGDRNSFFGGYAGRGNTSGIDNSGEHNSYFGYASGYFNTTGHHNSFHGTYSGYENTTGFNNAIFGSYAGRSNTGGDENAFFGFEAANSNTTGGRNVAVGAEALHANTTGWYNTAVGTFALDANTTAYENTAVGHSALTNSTGSDNTGLGEQSLYDNTTGHHNTGVGENVLRYNTTGSYNTAVGQGAGGSNTTQYFNSYFGASANGYAGVTNGTAVGYRAQVTQSNSLVLGSINGVNSGTADVDVGIGTTAPESPLHVKRSDGTAKLLVEETNSTPAIRQIYEMKNVGGVGFQMTDSRSGQESWQFQTNLGGNFSINNIGDSSGGTEFFLMQDTGNLILEGTVTAQGVLLSSDRNLKENFTDLDSQEILTRVSQLPVSEWNFKNQKESVRHVGPMAQDFHSAFGLGEDDKHISPLDAAGVALAAIQGLHDQLATKTAEIEGLKTQLSELESLKAELAEIKEMLRVQ